MKLFRIFLILCFIHCSVLPAQRIAKLSKKQMEDKVRGAWAGKMIGVMYGRSMEFKAIGKMYDDQIVWKPEMVENSLLEDDIYGQLNFMMTLERSGLDVTTDSLAKNFGFIRHFE